MWEILYYNFQQYIYCWKFYIRKKRKIRWHHKTHNNLMDSIPNNNVKKHFIFLHYGIRNYYYYYEEWKKKKANSMYTCGKHFFPCVLFIDIRCFFLVYLWCILKIFSFLECLIHQYTKSEYIYVKKNVSKISAKQANSQSFWHRVYLSFYI